MPQHEIVPFVLLLLFVLFCYWRPKPKPVKNATQERYKEKDLRPWQDW